MLKLTSPRGTSVWVKSEAIEIIMRDQDGSRHTLLGFNGPGTSLLVSESPEQVLAMLTER